MDILILHDFFHMISYHILLSKISNNYQSFRNPEKVPYENRYRLQLWTLESRILVDFAPPYPNRGARFWNAFNELSC